MKFPAVIQSILTDRLCLRPLTESDAPEILLHRSSEEMQRYTEIKLAESLDDATNFIQLVLGNIKEQTSVAWGICLKGEEKIIGSICLWNINSTEGIAELGYSIYLDFWGKGYATEAAKAVVEFGFEVMELFIIQAYSHRENIASIKLLTGMGFVKTGEEDVYNIYSLPAPVKNTIQLDTERLHLREAMVADAAFFLELLNTPDWLANIGDRGVKTLEDAQRFVIHRVFLTCRKNGFGSYLVELKSTGTPIGFCGLFKRDFLDDFDIGYALLPEFYGKGYATEAAKAVVELAKNKLGLTRLAAITIEKNTSSQKVLEKAGLRFERKFFAPGDKDELMLFGVDF